MYACKECGTGNPLDSSFCKKCGTALPEADLAEARGKMDEVLEEGNNLFTEGRTDEAMLIAEAAVAANPSSHMAYSLKGLCHERLGQIAEALECYETAVSLHPDSALDKVKVAALRNRLAAHVVDAPAPDRRRALTIASLAGVAVLALASLAAIGFSGKKAPEKGNLAMNTPAGNAPANFPTLGGGNTNLTTTNPTSGTPTTVVTPPTTATNPGLGSGIQLPTAPPGGVLPPATGGGVVIGGPDPETGTQPLVVPAPTEPAKPTKPGIDPDPTPVADQHGTVPDDKTHPTTPDDPGYINIQMSSTPKPTLGGGQPVTDGNAGQAVLKVAQDLYQMGKYDSAASKYRQVAGLGMDSPRVEQRIGDCYRNLGRSDQARSAYNRAITMYQAQIKQGHDVTSNQRGLDSCESALKVLGG